MHPSWPVNTGTMQCGKQFVHSSTMNLHLLQQPVDSSVQLEDFFAQPADLRLVSLPLRLQVLDAPPESPDLHPCSIQVECCHGQRRLRNITQGATMTPRHLDTTVTAGAGGRRGGNSLGCRFDRHACCQLRRSPGVRVTESVARGHAAT